MIQLMIPITENCCVKDNVVSLLCERQGLSAKEIWYRINKFRNVSYHGVYKAVCELHDGGVLEKTAESRYSLSSRWLGMLRTFVDSFHKNKRNKKIMQANPRIPVGIAQAPA